MALEAVVALTLVELVDELLLALELLQDLSSDLSLGELGRIRDDLLAVVQEDNLELDLGTGLALDLLNGDDVIGGDFILLAARRNDCVHVLALHASVVQQSDMVSGGLWRVNGYIQRFPCIFTGSTKPIARNAREGSPQVPQAHGPMAR